MDINKVDNEEVVMFPVPLYCGLYDVFWRSTGAFSLKTFQYVF